MKRYQSWILRAVQAMVLSASVCLCLETFGKQPSFPFAMGVGLISFILLIQKRF